MKELYKLKTEAVQYFKEDIATKILEKYKWKEYYNVDENALEKVDMPYLNYGIKTSENSANLGGWSKDDGTHLCFTIHFPSIKFLEHDKFSNGKMIRTLMDKIQRDIESHFIDFKEQLDQ